MEFDTIYYFNYSSEGDTTPFIGNIPLMYEIICI